MQYAEVAVNSPGGHQHIFIYSIPDSLDVKVGAGVHVPFGARVLLGIVTKLTNNSNVPDVREIHGLIHGIPLVSPERVQLALWISSHYLAPVFSSIALMLPPGFERKHEIKTKQVALLKLNPDTGLVNGAVAEMKGKRAFKQFEVLEYMQRIDRPIIISQIQHFLKCSFSTIRVLIAKGLLIKELVDVDRNPLAGREFPLEFPFTFTDDQQAAWQMIKGSISSKEGGQKRGTFLIHGVTGSGKTEVYLQSLAQTVKLGKKGICLVPEISLTPQIIDRFMGRFPGKVAVLHSRLSLGQRYDIWNGINRGDFDVVVGPRGAIFAPQPDLGLIIMDEEHEWAYKQSDQMPRYHARDVAVKLSQLTGATLILGSATPSLESYYRAEKGEYQLVKLPERVTPIGQIPLPEVNIVNMRHEYKTGGRGIFSRLLRSLIESAINKHEQVVLFINRRGLATFIQCRNCGFIPNCARCSAALTYHAASKRLICHHCRKSYPVIKKCQYCSGEDIKYFGIGTETVEAECRKLFPTAKVTRFDSDAMSKSSEYEAAVKSFQKHESDILVGTQLIAKGLNFPGVSLVGVVNADVGLNLPDFRSGERTFQLLCQVAGRAGRGTFAGKAVIQTFNPEYYAIKFAGLHDYPGFYRSEIKYRRGFGYPPFSNMIRLVYSHTKAEKCKVEADIAFQMIRARIETKGMPGIKIIGPTTTYIARLRGRYQMQIILLGRNLHAILNEINLPRGWLLDVDPQGMF